MYTTLIFVCIVRSSKYLLGALFSHFNSLSVYCQIKLFYRYFHTLSVIVKDGLCKYIPRCLDASKPAKVSARRGKAGLSYVDECRSPAELVLRPRAPLGDHVLLVTSNASWKINNKLIISSTLSSPPGIILSRSGIQSAPLASQPDACPLCPTGYCTCNG